MPWYRSHLGVCFGHDRLIKFPLNFTCTTYLCTLDFGVTWNVCFCLACKRELDTILSNLTKIIQQKNLTKILGFFGPFVYHRLFTCHVPQSQIKHARWQVIHTTIPRCFFKCFQNFLVITPTENHFNIWTTYHAYVWYVIYRRLSNFFFLL